jgi:hypothetical protein
MWRVAAVHEHVMGVPMQVQGQQMTSAITHSAGAATVHALRCIWSMLTHTVTGELRSTRVTV